MHYKLALQAHILRLLSKSFLSTLPHIWYHRCFKLIIPKDHEPRCFICLSACALNILAASANVYLPASLGARRRDGQGCSLRMRDEVQVCKLGAVQKAKPRCTKGQAQMYKRPSPDVQKAKPRCPSRCNGTGRSVAIRHRPTSSHAR
jgi:hypothetical protein